MGHFLKSMQISFVSGRGRLKALKGLDVYSMQVLANDKALFGLEGA